MAACVESALPGVKLGLHDDGARSGMYDFDLFRGTHRIGICEVTTAADGDSIALWNLVNGDDAPLIDGGLLGGWLITLRRTARARALGAELPGHLRMLESQGIRDADADPFLAARLRRLGVTSARRGPTSRPGSVYFTIYDPETAGLMVDSTGESVTDWLEKWLRGPSQADNLKKLSDSEVGERHLAVMIPGFTTAPAQVEYALMSDSGPTPSRPPALPEPLTTLWLASSWSSGPLFQATRRSWTRHTKPANARWPSR